MSIEALATDDAPARARSPAITGLSWGQVEVQGRETPYRDAKLWPGGSREWDWNETGTGHVPGIQPDDVREVVEHGAEIVVLSRGQNRRLQVKDETLEWLDEHGVETEVLETGDAVRRYNELREERAVGALIHSTC